MFKYPSSQILAKYLNTRQIPNLKYLNTVIGLLHDKIFYVKMFVFLSLEKKHNKMVTV